MANLLLLKNKTLWLILVKLGQFKPRPPACRLRIARCHPHKQIGVGIERFGLARATHGHLEGDARASLDHARAIFFLPLPVFTFLLSQSTDPSIPPLLAFNLLYK